ncbi:MAG: hypothetical protein ACSHX0_09650 [Akkermansiaceae bacterium]
MKKGEHNTPHKSNNGETIINEDDLWDIDDEYTSTEVPSPLETAQVIESIEVPPIEEPLVIAEVTTPAPAAVSEPAVKKDEAPTSVAQSSKFSLGIIETVALALIALLLLGTATASYIWLYKKNQLANQTTSTELPAQGKYATIQAIDSYWKSAVDLSNVKLGTELAPVAVITLGKSSNSGALRLFFSDENNNLIGDPIDLTVSNGLFSNGEKTIEVNATNGLSNKMDLLSYQIDEHGGSWQITIKEAENSLAKGSEFVEIIQAAISPVEK